jgi:hypothetical protein
VSHPYGVVKPCRSDFIADVELTAKAALSEKEHLWFRLLNIDGMGFGQQLKVIRRSPDFKKFEHSIQERLGRAFLSRGIYPVADYFRPHDVRPFPTGRGDVRLEPLPTKVKEPCPEVHDNCTVCSEPDMTEILEEADGHSELYQMNAAD